MARASKRAGFGQQRGAISPRITYAEIAPSLPKNGDEWIKKSTSQKYVYDKASTSWIPLFGAGGGGNLGGLSYHNDTNTTAVSTNVEVGTVDVTMAFDGSLVVTGTFVGTASTTMTITSLIKLDTVTQHTAVQYISGAVDDTVSFSVVLEGVEAGDYTISVDMAASTGTFTLDASEQHLYALTYYDAVIGGGGGGFVGTKYNVFGGFDGTGGGTLSDNDQYLPSGSSWTAKTNLPTAVFGASTFRINLLGYICRDTNNNEYNESADSFTSKASLPSPNRNRHSGITLNSKGYCIGGSLTLADNDEYDASGNSWVSQTNKTTGVSLFGTCVLSSKIYCFCGYTGSASQINEEYVVDTWASKTNAPSPARQANDVNSATGKGYTVGGFNPSTYYADNDEYDSSGDSWSSKTDQPLAKSEMMVASISDELYTCFGQRSTGYNRTHYKYTISGDSWGTETFGVTPDRIYVESLEFA